MPVDITSVTLAGPGAEYVRVWSPHLTLSSVDESTTSNLSRLPYRLPANHQLWVSAQVELTSCGFVKLDTLKLRVERGPAGSQERNDLEVKPWVSSSRSAV